MGNQIDETDVCNVSHQSGRLRVRLERHASGGMPCYSELQFSDPTVIQVKRPQVSLEATELTDVQRQEEDHAARGNVHQDWSNCFFTFFWNPHVSCGLTKIFLNTVKKRFWSLGYLSMQSTGSLHNCRGNYGGPVPGLARYRWKLFDDLQLSECLKQ